MQKFAFLSNFWLKIIAIVTMTIDHLGLILSIYYLTDTDALVVTMRSIGRLALPLYCFMIVEGVIHTRNFFKYFLRLGIMAVIISIALVVMGETNIFSSSMIKDAGNIFMDLTLGAVGVYCLMNKNWYIKLLAILPLGFGIASTLVCSYVFTHGGQIYWLPYFFRTQYGWFGIALIYAFWFGFFVTRLFLRNHAKEMNVEETVFEGTTVERNAINIVDVILLVAVSVGFVISLDYIPFNIIDEQLWCVLTGALLLLYNGKRGYNKKWFEYGCYLYYPIHIAILGLIFYLINL